MSGRKQDSRLFQLISSSAKYVGARPDNDRCSRKAQSTLYCTVPNTWRMLTSGQLSQLIETEEKNN